MDTNMPPRPRLFQRRRRLVAETTLSRRFEFETLEPRVLMSADLLPVHGTLDVPGQVNRYTFSLTDAKQIYFDSQTPNASIDWTLQGPQGVVVDHRAFTQSDSFGQGGTAALSLVAGNYTLNVSGASNATGGYDFHLLDLGAAKPITVGQQVSGTLDPGNEALLYQFSGTAGEQVFFDSHQLGAQSTSWRVIGPENTLVFGPNGLGSDPNTTTLERSGNYTVVIDGGVGQASPANFAFTVNNVSTAQQALTLGQTVTGDLTAPGNTDRYSFSVAGKTSVVFDSLAARGDLTWTLTGAAGDVVTARPFASSDAASIGGSEAATLQAGSYTLTVAGTNSATGPYGFRLLDLAGGTAANPGDTLAGSTGDAGYAAQASHLGAGAPLANPVADRSFNVFDAGVNATVPANPALTPPAFTVEAWVNPPYGATGPATIVRQGAPGAGYALLLGQDGKLQFDLDGTILEAPSVLADATWTHVAATFDGTTMRLVVNGVDVADQAFTGPAAYDGNGLTIGAADPTGTSRWTGAIDELRIWSVARTPADIAASSGQEAAPQPNLAAVYHFDEASGLTLADSSGNGLDATIGNLPGTATQLYSLNLVAGQKYTLSIPSASGDLTARIYEPSGNLLFGPSGLYDGNVITATVGGTYTLAIEGNVYTTSAGQYTVSLVPSTTTSNTLVIGADTSGSIALPSQSQAYTFTLNSPSQLLFDALATASYGLDWSLAGPSGTVVASTSLQASDPTSLNLAAGAYTLTVNGAGSTTGAYSFRLLDTAAATPFALGDDVSAAVDEPGGAALYSFTAQAGDTVSLNVEASSGSGTWQLRDPYGRVVFGQQGLYSQTGLGLAATGTYVLVVDDGANQDGTTAVQFASSLDSHTDPATLTGAPISFGTGVAGTIDSAGDPDLYTFTATAGQRLHFVSQTQNGYPSYTITGPRGTELSKPFYDDNSPAIDLPLAGTYQIAVTGSSNAAYAFRLDDLGQAAALATDGTAATGAIDAQSGSVAYQFRRHRRQYAAADRQRR